MSEISVTNPLNDRNISHFANPIDLSLPPIIGICGHPGSGKSEVQRILSRDFGYTPVDDGEPVRAIAIEHLGLSHDDVYTQEGKAGWRIINGKRVQNRDTLGRIGIALEEQFGENILAWLACRNLDPAQRHSFGSVRRRQAVVYRARGGKILGVRRPGVGPSRYDFDWFDESLVDVWVDNDGNLDDLRAKIRAAIQSAF